MLAPPNCHFRKCKHYQGVRDLDERLGEETEVIYCKAFPNGIPDEIGYGDNEHTDSFEGDNGIQFVRE